MNVPANGDTRGAEDAQARRWLALLQAGSPDEKASARRGLARIFEARGMVSEAVGLLETNAREGYRESELYRALARMYRLLGDEYRAASATLEATRLAGGQAHDRSPPAYDRPDPEPRTVRPPPEPPRSPGPEAPPPRPGRAPPRPEPGRPPPWRLPLRVAGWIVVAATMIGAAAISPQQPFSAALYLLSATALALLLASAVAPRRLVRLPDGPLGDGALLFVWLLALLAAGALLPQPVTMPGHPTERATPGPIRTPSPGPSPTSSGSGPASPTPSPAP